jgi:hypothetical protein
VALPITAALPAVELGARIAHDCARLSASARRNIPRFLKLRQAERLPDVIHSRPEVIHSRLKYRPRHQNELSRLGL